IPSKPLFGMPVAVGISEAVIAMRSTVSLAAGAAKASEALRAKAKAGRNDMRALLRNRRDGGNSARSGPVNLPLGLQERGAGFDQTSGGLHKNCALPSVFQALPRSFMRIF